jgi:tetratricopeptide (TPR) repeat protein
MSSRPPAIFISHTHTDRAIADAIRDAVRELFGDRVVVNYSTNKELEGGIQPGEDWFGWINEHVRDAQVAFILLTPTSVQRPWVLWEAGAVAGVMLSGEQGSRRKLRPISYRLRGSEVPSPFGRDQVTDGLAEADVARLFEDLVRQFADGLPADVLIKTAQRLAPACANYLSKATEALRIAPLMVTEAAVQEWLERIDALEKEERFSEAEELHDWLNLAFGRDSGAKERPLDLRIHRCLGELYARANLPDRAAREFDMARQLAPRDVYILRRLGKAYLDQKRWSDAGTVIQLITSLDERAFIRNAENAALKARWHLEQGAPTEAAAVLKAALDQNPRSYYLADLLGQTLLSLGQREQARQIYAQALNVIGGLRERSVWVVATGFTAALVTGDKPRQQTYLQELARLSPSGEQAESIRRGVEKVIRDAGLDAVGLSQLDAAMGLGLTVGLGSRSVS